MASLCRVPIAPDEADQEQRGVLSCFFLDADEFAHERGGQRTERLRVIDWEQPANPAIAGLVSQFSVTGALYTCRPDLVGFVNGLPLVVIELKKPGVGEMANADVRLSN
jgi:type I site-specific restriction-modification system R (restriction) subunit